MQEVDWLSHARRRGKRVLRVFAKSCLRRKSSGTVCETFAARRHFRTSRMMDGVLSAILPNFLLLIVVVIVCSANVFDGDCPG